MSEELKRRTKKFALDVIRVCHQLPQMFETRHAISQVIRSSSSVAANWVFTAEHLAAIALQTGRAKDKARLLQFVETGALDPARFQAILTRHGLPPAWQRFEQQFLTS